MEKKSTDRLAFKNDSECSIYNEWKPTGDELFIAGYEGVPQNLILNFVCFMLIILGFCWARKFLWNFGRIAINDRNRMKFKEVYTRHSNSEIKLIPDNQDYIISTKKRIVEHEIPEFDDVKLNDAGMFRWIKIVFSLSDDHLFVKSGYDACIYLSFQRHVLFILLIVTIISLLIVLPVHLTGTELQAGENEESSLFRQSTIGNIAPDDPRLFVHVTLGFFYFLLTCSVMRHFIRGLMRTHKDNFQPRTVAILGIPSKMCHAEKVRGHLEECYPSCKIENISFVYATKNLQGYEWDKSCALSALSYCLSEYENTKERPTLRPVTCGFNIHRLCNNPNKEVDAIDYYSNIIRDMKNKSDFERARTLGRPMGSAFVTFRSVLLAERMINDYDDFKRFIDKFISHIGPYEVDRTPKTHYSQKLGSKDWTVGPAPLSSDIVWENYGVPLAGWYLKWIMVNVAVILMALCFSTPVILLKTLNYYIQFHKGTVKHSRVDPSEVSFWTTFGSVFMRILPALLIWVGATTLPCLVSVSDLMIAYWTNSALNYSRMIKTYIFLVMMVIILPSFGLSSIASLLNEERVKWECIFDSRNQSFYINYVITCSFIGCAAELWRMPELFLISCKMLFKKSKAENIGNLSYCLWDFQVGLQYAWMLLPFTITTLFCLVNPLLTPCGLVYLVMKHFMDRYNIFFAYSKCHVYRSIHQGAAQIAITAMLLLQFVVYTYIQLITWTTISTHTYLHGYSTLTTCLSLLIFCLKNHWDCVEPINLVYREEGHSLPQYNTPYAEYEHYESDSEEFGSSDKDSDGDTMFTKTPESSNSAEFDFKFLTQSKSRRRTHRRHALPQIQSQFSQLYFQTIPRIPIQPNNPYFAPFLRKDYPFTYPGRNIEDTKKLSIFTIQPPAELDHKSSTQMQDPLSSIGGSFRHSLQALRQRISKQRNS